MTQRRKQDDVSTNEDDPILKCPAVARQLGYSPSTIARWIREKLIRAHRMPNGHWGVRKSEVNAILAANNLNTNRVQ